MRMFFFILSIVNQNPNSYVIFESLITKTKVSPLKSPSQTHSSDVLMIMLCSRYDTCCTELYFPFQSYFKQFIIIMLNSAHLKEIIHYLSALIYQTH